MQASKALERDAMALRLRGHTYVEIGEACGVTAEGARRACQRAMAEIRTETAETAAEVREQEAARLDAVLVRLAELAEQSADESTALAVIDRLLRVQDRRAKLLGLDLQRTEITGPGGGPLQIATIQRVIVDAPTARVIDATPVQQALPAPTEDPIPTTPQHVDVVGE